MKKDMEKIPEFKTLEEEREYWEARGPLADGHKGRISKPVPGHQLSSFLAVRLTGAEITKLRDIAAKQGMGPSTYARMLLTSAMENQSKPEMVTLSEIKNMMENFINQPPALSQTKASEKKARYKT